MMNKRWWEQPVCFLCDYGLALLVFLLVIGVGIWRWGIASPATPTSLLPTATNFPTSASPFPTQAQTPLILTPSTTQIPEKVNFILVFIPVNWQSSEENFMEIANRHADLFVSESHIDEYFDVWVTVAEGGLSNADLESDDLVVDIEEFGIINYPGDRYIGITDGDLALDGDTSVSGWTAGGGSMVVEADGDSITAHEIGHTFGLCDEYNYQEWSRQNDELIAGCPNSYPDSCPTDITDSVVCDGQPTLDGRNSIMGPSGLPGAYGFNQACQEHLRKMFSSMTGIGME